MPEKVLIFHNACSFFRTVSYANHIFIQFDSNSKGDELVEEVAEEFDDLDTNSDDVEEKDVSKISDEAESEKSSEDIDQDQEGWITPGTNPLIMYRQLLIQMMMLHSMSLSIKWLWGLWSFNFVSRNVYYRILISTAVI